MMKRFIRVAMLLYVVTVLLSALSFKTIEAKAATASGKVFQNRFSSTSCGKWSVVPSPNSNVVPNGLSAVATVSANDVWAVGSSGSQMGGGQTLIEHWNGTSWSVMKSARTGLTAVATVVAAVAAAVVWAGGKTGVDQTLIEHWNGTSWSVVKSPSPGSGDDLRGVAAVSASNVWATGYTVNGSSIQTLVEHWNGTSWQVVKSPNVGTSPALWAVAAVSANDVWAVGSDSNSNNMFQTLTEQWNGKQWSVVKSPSPGSFSTQLLGVAAVSANDVWSVGYADSNTLIEYYHC